MNRYRVDWHPNGYGAFVAVFDASSGLVVAASESRGRAELEELARLANKGQELEQADAGLVGK